MTEAKAAFVDEATLPGLEKEMTAKSLLEQAGKMLGIMGTLKEGQTVVMVGDFAQDKTKIKIVGDGSEKGSEVEYGYLNNRYRKLEKEALKSRQAEREQVEVTVAMHLGKSLPEIGAKFVDVGEDYLADNTQVDVWKKKDGRPIVERLRTAELIKSFDDEKISFTQAIKNLKKVYGSTKLATEKYINQKAIGKVFGKAFEAQAEKTEAMVQEAERLDSVPEQKRGFLNRLQRGINAIKQAVDKPLAPVAATAKAVVGFALYDANPLATGKIGQKFEKIWAETPISTTIPALKDVSMREAAARLEEKLVVDPLTGEGVRSGPITPDKIREASVAGAEWAFKMNVLPGLLAKLPLFEALSAGELYSLIRSSKMITGGAKSVEAIAKKIGEAETPWEKAKVAAWVLGAGVGFTAAEKLSPVIGGAINPVLMADIALMRLVGEVEKHSKDKGLEMTDAAETLKTVEEAVTISFAADSAVSVGDKLWTFAETGSTNPLEQIKDEESLLELVEKHPEYLAGEGGGIFGDIRRLEHGAIEEVKGVKMEDNPWKTFNLEDGEVIHVDPGTDGQEPTIIKQTSEGDVYERHGEKWVEVVTEQEPIREIVKDDVVETQVGDIAEEKVEPVQAVHDYVYYEPGSTKMAFRMDLVPGETWEQKVDRLFDGYKSGGIDDPSIYTNYTGKDIQGMGENTQELRELTGSDGVYERQIHKDLIVKLMDDAKTNGLVYDEKVVKERLVAFLQADATADADTVEGEVDYGQLYQNLFVGSEVVGDVKEISTEVYKPYFLSGNEGTSRGIEVNIAIDSGDTVLGELAKQGYGHGDGQLYKANGEVLSDAQIIKLNPDGSETVISDFAELDLVQPNDKFVVRTGEEKELTEAQGEMPEIIGLPESKMSSWELPPSEQEAAVAEQEWMHTASHNENGEIYMGVVGRDSDLTHMMLGRFSGLMDNPWDVLPILQDNMDSGQISIVALTYDSDGKEVGRRILNSYDDLRTLQTGETILIDDDNRLLSDIPDQVTKVVELEDVDLAKDDSIVPAPPPLIAGFTDDGRLDLDNPPESAVRDSEGLIYVGRIQDGTWLSMLIASHLPSSEGIDTWQKVNELYESGQIEILKVVENGELQKIENIDLVYVGDQIVIKDVSNLLTEVKSIAEVESQGVGAGAPVIELPILPIEHAESEDLAVADIKAKLEAVIGDMDEEVNIGITVMDLDNSNNLIELGNRESFNSGKVQEIAIAMAILRSVDSGRLDLASESRFVVLPGDYKPSLEHLLNLMIVHGDPSARDGLLKELVGQDMNVLLGEDTGLNEVLSKNTTTTSEAAKLYQTLLRTNYLSDESRNLLEEIIVSSGSEGESLLLDDLSSTAGIEVTEVADSSAWAGMVGGEQVPEYSTFAKVSMADGRDLVVVITADSGDPDLSRSAFRTVARELALNLGQEKAIESDNELVSDVAQIVSESGMTQLDYVNHVISPYRTASGAYVLDPVVKAEIDDIEELDLTQFDKQVATYADGSGIFHLTDPNTGRVVSVFVGANQHATMVLDSQELSSSAIKYEVYQGESSNPKFVELGFTPDSDEIKVNLSMELAGYADLTSSSGRAEFIDTVRAKGKDYDFYLFAADPGKSGPVIVYGRNGERRDLGTLPTDVSVAVVASSVDIQIESEQTQAAWDLLKNKLGTTKEVTDIVWIDQGMPYSETDDTWDTTQDHWFNQLVDNDATPDGKIYDQRDIENAVFAQVVSDTLGVEVAPDAGQALVDGVDYIKTAYIPEGMTIDPAVVARSNDIPLEDLVITVTNDSNIFLVGERVASDQYDNPEIQASFEHPHDELIFQYRGEYMPQTETYSTYLSPSYEPTDEHPLLSVYPLERPLETYLETDKLIKLSDKAEVKLQYQAEPYFVLSDEGSRKDIYVNPYNMVSYVKSGTEFIPLVLDSYTYSEMAEVYGITESDHLDVVNLWERRVSDAMMLEARAQGVKTISVDGKLVIYDELGSARDQVLGVKHDESGNVMVDAKGHIVLEDTNGELRVFYNGQFVSGSAESLVSIDKYLDGFEYVTSEDGLPLQYRGFPVLSKDELLYIVSHDGVVLVGSKTEFDLEGYVSDGDLGSLLDNWEVKVSTGLKVEEKSFASYETELEKIIHDLAVTNDRIIGIENGVVDIQTRIKYLGPTNDSELMFDSESGKIVLKNMDDGKPYIWSGDGWVDASSLELQPRDEYLKSHGLVQLEDNFSRGVVIDRRTGSEVYVKDNWAYVMGGNGLVRIGEVDAVIKAGFIGYLDDTNKFQTYTPTTLREIYGNAQYTVAERVSMVMNPLINNIIGIRADIGNLWADYDLTDVLPTIKREDYVTYEQLPPQYVAALISQENKTLYRSSEGEATNLDFGVLVKVILSGGDRGGSTLVQGLVKNLLMSPEERLERSLNRKISEVFMADQILETMTVEEVVAMYSNTVSYGSINGVEITGVGQASEVLFGKDLKDLDLVEVGLLVAVPNYPTRNNLLFHENAVGWADSASGVYRHMYENGFITESEMEQAFLDVHNRLLANGSESDIEYLLSHNVINESDVEWVKQAAEEYQSLDFSERKLLERITETQELQLGMYGLADSSVVPLAPQSVGVEPVVTTEKTMVYADFFQYLRISHPDKFNEFQPNMANDMYFWYGKVPAGEKIVEKVDHMAIDSDINVKNIGVAYTTEEFDSENPVYIPQVEIDDDKNVKIDSWAHRYEAIEKDEAGNAKNYSVVATGGDGTPLVQDENGVLWQVTSNGLVRQPGRIYQVEGGGAVQALPANDRQGMLVDATGSEIRGGRYVRDMQGNYFIVLEGNRVDFVGQVMLSSDGRNVLFELDSNTSFEVAQTPADFLKIAVKNMLNYRGSLPESKLDSVDLPISNDPNLGYVQPQGLGEYGLINPSGAESYFDSQGIPSVAIELSNAGHGREIFEKYLGELVTQDRPVLVWLNSDLATDVITVKNEGTTQFETISRHERPVSVLQIFEFEGNKFVVYQDPTQASPQTVTFDRFAELASPSDIGRYKTLVLGEYEIADEYRSYLYNPKDQFNQVGVVLDDGYVYNYDNPGQVEAMMSINPGMQQFVTEEAKRLLSETGGRGVVFMAMDDSGRMPFYVALDKDGLPDPDMANATYQPGSVFKLVTSMSALYRGVDPYEYRDAGDWYQLVGGAKVYNWTMDPVTGLLNYNSGAAAQMNMIEALRESNNPYQLGVVNDSPDVNALPDYARLAGFGDGQVVGNIPTNDSVVSDTRSSGFNKVDILFEGIGQGPVAVSVLEMLTFVSTIANNGKIVVPVLSRELSIINDVRQLPNAPGDYAIMAEAMHQVATDPRGTAFQSFGDFNNYGYTVYAKTGTAETGDEPNAWFVGWAVDNITGEKLSFAFLVPNGGEGSHVAAPFARKVLDKYFSDLRANEALKAESALPVEVGIEPARLIENIDDVEQGVLGFNLENQPNEDMIKFTIAATDIANDFVPSSPDLRHYDEGVEFVTYLKESLTQQGYGDIVNSPAMTEAYSLLQNEYKSYSNEVNGQTLFQPVQCQAWEIFLAGARGIEEGAPIAMTRGGNADAIVGDVARNNLQTGDPAGLGHGETIVRFDNDRVDIRLFEPGDAFFIRYKFNETIGDFGHTGVILATAKSFDNQPMVLVSDSNRYVDDLGNLVTDGKPRVRWLTQAQFVEQYEREGDSYAGIAPSQIIAVRLNPEARIQSVIDDSYSGTTNGAVQVQSAWEMTPDENGNLVLPFENSLHLLEEHVGEMEPIEAIYVHWSGADSADTSTWTAEMVKNGLEGEETSATFAVGVDAIWQLAKMEPGKVQATYATPWRSGVVNIEIAGQDFDNNPPSPEQYERVVQLTTELLISANKPISILKPHYEEMYLWSAQMPRLDGTLGNWVLIDSEDLAKAKFFNDATQTWEPLDTFVYDYETIVQKKVDPGEKFFAQLQEDVKKRLIELGRGDLLSDEVLLVPEIKEIPGPIVRLIDTDHPITREEIKIEIEPYLVSVDAVSPMMDEAAVENDIRLHSSLIPDLTELVTASREANIGLYLTSGYRSFNEQIMALALVFGDETLARPPGESQHHSGLAIDFTSSEEGIEFTVGMEVGFENSETGKWLAENGWKYGFVQAYTKNHDGVQNEPWHYYYLGKDLAKVWHESQLSDNPMDMFEILEQANTQPR